MYYNFIDHNEALKKSYILTNFVPFKVNLNDVLNTRYSDASLPQTASMKHHAEVSIFGPIHTYTYRHNINENDRIKEKSKDKQHDKKYKLYTYILHT